MRNFQKQLSQIAQIRELRVRSRLREQGKRSQEVQLAEKEVERTILEVSQQEQQAITFQRDGMAKLVDGNLVGIDRLVEFNTQKLKFIKNIADSKTDVIVSRDEHARALENLSVSEQATREAEKRLIGIEEVIQKQLWK